VWHWLVMEVVALLRKRLDWQCSLWFVVWFWVSKNVAGLMVLSRLDWRALPLLTLAVESLSRQIRRWDDLLTCCHLVALRTTPVTWMTR